MLVSLISTVAVPRDALVERAGQAFVYKVGENNTAEQVTVDINAIVGLWVGVADGISAGEQVIVRGAERLQPGQAVEIIDTIGARQTTHQ